MVCVDIADKLNLIAPIAEQCQHKCVLLPVDERPTTEGQPACSIASVPRRNMRLCTENMKSGQQYGPHWPAVSLLARYITFHHCSGSLSH